MRAAVQPGPTAIRLAILVAGMASRPAAPARRACAGHPGRPRRRRPRPSARRARRAAPPPASAAAASALASQNTTRMQLGAEQAERLEQGQVPVAAADPGQQRMAERAHRQQARAAPPGTAACHGRSV